MRFIILASLNSLLHSIQISWELCNNWQRLFGFLSLLWPWIKVKVITLESKSRVQQYLPSYLLPSLNPTDLQTSKCMPPFFFFFFDAVSKTAAISLALVIFYSKPSQDVQLELLHHNISFNPDQVKSAEKMKTIGLSSCWPCDPRQGQGQRKWYKMVEVNDAHTHGTYDKLRLNNLGVMHNVRHDWLHRSLR